jgi:hypothetical protein
MSIGIQKVKLVLRIGPLKHMAIIIKPDVLRIAVLQVWC